MTLVFASHNLGQVKRLATRVVYLEQGRVLADLPVDEFLRRAAAASILAGGRPVSQGRVRTKINGGADSRRATVFPQPPDKPSRG